MKWLYYDCGRVYCIMGIVISDWLSIHGECSNRAQWFMALVI